MTRVDLGACSREWVNSVFVRGTAVWDLAAIAIVVKSRHFVERRDFPPLRGSRCTPYRQIRLVSRRSVFLLAWQPSRKVGIPELVGGVKDLF